MIKKPKIYTSLQALAKAQDWCAYQERCQQEVRDKLYSYGLHQADVENLLSKLISDNYVYEERFAKAYAGGKFRINKWGRHKIEFELKLKGIPESMIHKGIEEIDEADYQRVLRDLILKKQKEIKPEKDLN